MTADPPAQVAVTLAALRPVADEIVVAADSRVDVDSLAPYDAVADDVVRFTFRPPIDRPRAWLARRCSGDWLLSIDGDEVPSRALVDALPDLVAAQDVQQCWLPRRWLFPDADSWLAEAPWWPDFQVRLLHNDATLAARAELHGGFVGVLPARHVDAPLYHLDTLVNDAATRAAKAARYEAEAPGRRAYGGGPLSDVMYRPERWSTGAAEPVPEEDRELIEQVLAARAGAAGGSSRPASRPVARGDVAGTATARPDHDATGAGPEAAAQVPPLAPDADIDACATTPDMRPDDYAVGLRLYEATGGDGALRLAPGETRPLYVEVENRGGAIWRWGLEQQPLVRLGHRWCRASGDVVREDGRRSPLPCTLRPGESAIVPLWVEAPATSGEHVLEVDLVHEHVRWFDAPLRLPVSVRDRPSADAPTVVATDDATPSPTLRTDTPQGPRDVLITTVIARNYLPQARVLARTFRRHHPDGRVVVLVLDAPGDGLRDDEPFDILAPADLFPPSEHRELRRMMAIYDVMELATALKPFLLRHLLAAGAPSATYLDPDIAVYGQLGDIAAAAEQHGIVLTPHRLSPVPDDGLEPDELVYAQCGAYNLGFVSVGQGGLPFLDWWADRCRRDCLVAKPDGLFVDQRWVDLAAAYFPPVVLRDPGVNVAYWNLDERPPARDGDACLVGGAPLRLFHFSGYDPDEPHLFSRYFAGRARIVLSESPILRRLCEDYGQMLVDEGWRECSKLAYGLGRSASGMRLDTLMRRVLRQEILRRERGAEHDPGSVDEVPDPYDPAGAHAFVELLRTPFPNSAAPRIPRYLYALYEGRPELRSSFPELTGLAGNHFLWWVREMGHEVLALPPDLLPREDEITGDGAPESPTRTGVRLVGYLTAELGLGEAGRAMAASLAVAGEHVEPVVEARTSNRQRHTEGIAGTGGAAGALPAHGPGPAGGDLDVNVIAVNADGLPATLEALGSSFTEGRYTVGMWAWEVDDFPDPFAASAALVDEVWANSRHAAAAIARKVDVPVYNVPPPVVERAPSTRSRADLGLPDGFLFLFCFDFFSVAQRKNPVGVVEAFRRAFAPGEGPRLVVKSINGDRVTPELERLRHAARDRPDIAVVDRYNDVADQRALIAACDAYVSLHRAEGFGYTMAEAMLAAKPVIATGYSGNLEFMDERNSFLVDHGMSPIPPRCDPYPEGGLWAEPDLDRAAELMRRVVDDPAGAAAVGERARDDIRRFHTPEARAPLVAARLAAARAVAAERAAAHAALVAPGTVWSRAARLGRAGGREAARIGRRLARELG
jgi:glycosyltransferase involved in cell wall biosynthesis